MLNYIIQSAVYLGGCFAFYKLFLQKETFYKLNRYVLAVGLVLCFLLPLGPMPEKFSFRKADAIVTETTGSSPLAVAEPEITAVQAHPSVLTIDAAPARDVWIRWAVYLYWTGVAIFSVNFLLQLFIVFRRACKYPSIKDGRVRIVELPGDKAPCSFANNVFINPSKYDWDTYSQVLMHEKIHVLQWHTLDIVLAEFVIIFQWFNPFAWLYRKEVENNLEFLTDQEVLGSNVDRVSYQMSLLKVSAPHLPLNITTNYNQQLLKKRLAMMNARRSNTHTAWKYLFMLPMFACIASFVNKPVAQVINTGTDRSAHTTSRSTAPLQTEGTWFGKIRNEKLQIQLKGDGDDPDALNGSVFNTAAFSKLPFNADGNFTLVHDAGTIYFSGKFEGDDGTGRYRFAPDQSYVEFLKQQNISGVRDDRDLLTLFLVDAKRSYIKMLRDNGFTQIRKSDLVPMAALNIDEDYIRSIRANGFPNISLSDLVPIKSMQIDGAYITALRNAGYSINTPAAVIDLKAKGVPGKAVNAMINDNASGAPPLPGPLPNTLPGKSPNGMIRENHADQYSSPATATVQPPNNVAGELDVDYLKTLARAGITKITSGELQQFKLLHITREYLDGFKALGYGRIPAQTAISLKASGATAEFVKGFANAGYTDIPLGTIATLSAMHITPATIESYKKIGFNNITLAEVIDAQASGTMPSSKTKKLNNL